MKNKLQINKKLDIEYVALSEVNVLPMNFKRHATEDVAASIIKRGFIDPIGYNPKTKNSYDGNGRTEALELLHDEWMNDRAKPVPDGIGVDGDEWFVPAVFVEMSEIEEQSAGAALNRLNELGGYDEGLMLEVLQELKEKEMLDATGYTDDDIKALLKKFPQAKDSEPDESPDEAIEAAVNGEPVESNVKQVALLYNPEQHLEFQNLAMNAQELFQTDNLPDTILRALKYSVENVELDNAAKSEEVEQ